MDLEMTESVWLYFLSKTIFLGKLEFGHYPHHDKKHTTGNGQNWTGYLLWSKTAKISPNRVTTELFLEEE